MDFFLRAAAIPTRLGILPGTFNPPTNAHLALAHAAGRFADEVLFVLPRTFPHKPYTGAAFDERVAMLQAILAGETGVSVASTASGLFVDIAAECQAAYGANVRLSFICGRDAAERIVNWDYGHPGALTAMLDQFDLMVAARRGDYQPPHNFRHRIHPLEFGTAWEEVSATEVRRRIAAGEPFEHLVPPQILPELRKIFHTPDTI